MVECDLFCIVLLMEYLYRQHPIGLASAVGVPDSCPVRIEIFDLHRTDAWGTCSFRMYEFTNHLIRRADENSCDGKLPELQRSGFRFLQRSICSPRGNRQLRFSRLYFPSGSPTAWKFDETRCRFPSKLQFPDCPVHPVSGLLPRIGRYGFSGFLFRSIQLCVLKLCSGKPCLPIFDGGFGSPRMRFLQVLRAA